ncbi:salicylate hydroxylase [Apiospora arundinis]|uniref:Salicylate hydroxylase n=1 Tax=Apiospora arundinis TaxID=335852 RepID=A0ABR2J902_9PEZI
MLSPPDSTRSSRLHVAVIGGGITGVTLALGLLKRGIDFTIYERASGIKEIGAGVGFSPNAEEALKALDPRVHQAYKNVATPNGEDYFQWIDGYGSDEVIYKLYVGEQGFQGCRRSAFIEELAKLLPAENIKFSKEIESIVDDGEGRVELKFKDGTSEMTDVAIGCDGIRSRVRDILVGKEYAASYTQKFCFRGLVPMEKAYEHISKYRASTRFMYNGPDAHSITYPVGEFLNVLLVVSDPEPWQAPEGKHTAFGPKDAAIKAFEGWQPSARGIVDLLPNDLDKWAVFDMLEHPAPYYARGSVAIAGDAAHATGPHLGAGAGFGMEDALALAGLLEAVDQHRSPTFAITKALFPEVGTKGDNDKSYSSSSSKTATKSELVHKALAAYQDIRYERTQWLIKATREASEMFQWQYEPVGNDPVKFGEEITRRFYQIWNYDVHGMVKGAIEDFHRRVAPQKPVTS